MRANITYSVDMEKIPEEITRIIEGQVQILQSNLVEVQEKLREKNFTSARQSMLRAREALGGSDLRLYELDQILASYVDMINKVDEQEEESVDQEAEPLLEEEEVVEDG